MEHHIILASRSPRRQELLRQMGLSFTTVDPKIDEQKERHLAPRKLVETISREKAWAVWKQAGPETLVIAADTVVLLDGRVLGKPLDRADALRMLSALQGRDHQVYTGFTVLWGAQSITCSERTRVTFRPLTEAEIKQYISTGEPMDKAGAYGIQGYGALLVKGIRGDYFNVMGLPVCALGQALRELGVDCLSYAAKDTAPSLA